MFTHHGQSSLFRSPYFPASLAALLFLSCSIPLPGQSFYPQKDLVFTQVIASSDFESVLTLTNRGPEEYSGEFLLYTGADGSIWNPEVNGSRISGGYLPISIQPDATEIFRIGDDSSTVAVGYVVIFAGDMQADNNLEGNLTYFYQGASVLRDAVGVPPSKEFFRSSLPFNNFDDVGLSLANPPFGPATDAEIAVVLYDRDGKVVSSAPFVVPDGGHRSLYLKEFTWPDPIASMTGQPGKVILRSSEALSGIAMTITPDGGGNAQISTLPLEGTPVLYTLNALELSTKSFGGDLALWLDGPFARGYLVVKHMNGYAVEGPTHWLVNGEYRNATLILTFRCGLEDLAAATDISLYLEFPGFSPSGLDTAGTWRGDMVESESVPLRGTVNIHREN